MLLNSLLCRRTYQESVFAGHYKLFTTEKLYYWQAQMSLWDTRDTKNLVAVITAVIWHKISSNQFIKWHKTTLKYCGLSKQIWSVKSQFCNKFYAEKSLWSCRIYCKTAMEVSILKYKFLILNFMQEMLTFLTTYLCVFIFAVSHFTAIHHCALPQCRSPPTEVKALYFSSQLNWFPSPRAIWVLHIGSSRSSSFQIEHTCSMY